VSLLHRLEPLLWLLFGAGGFLAALLLPGLLFALGIAGPLGWFPERAVSWHRMHALAANPVGRLLLAALLSLVAWHAAHHLRHLALDLGLKRIEGPLAALLYGLAALTSAASVAAVAAL
jgi:fumarate reductase subunit D